MYIEIVPINDIYCDAFRIAWIINVQHRIADKFFAVRLKPYLLCILFAGNLFIIKIELFLTKVVKNQELLMKKIGKVTMKKWR